ncbi:hypothetical protein EO082_07455 [Aeromonas veronii]|nr:hypothetical protein EO082_07455 [Aeromonas veronii]
MARFFYGYCLSAHPVPNHRVSTSFRNDEYASERQLGVARRAMERWNDGTMERWNDGTMERWNDGTMERWNEKSVTAMSGDR